MATDDPFDFLPMDDAPAEPSAPGEPAVQITEPVAAPPGEPVQPEPPASPQTGFVPLATVLDEREKRQAAQRRAEELETRLKAFEQPVKVPDVTSDPQGWQAAQEARISKAEMDLKMNLSGRYAAQTFGQEPVSAAMEWGRQQTADDPFFGQKFLNHPDPFGFLVAEHRRANALGKLGDKTPEDWALEYAASQGWQVGGAVDGTQQPAVAIASAKPAPAAPTAPTRSLARVAGAGAPAAAAPIQDGDLVKGLWEK